MKTYEDVWKILTTSMLERFRVTEEQLVPTTSFKEDLELDSLDMTDLLCEIEDQYGCELINTSSMNDANVSKEEKELAMGWYEAANGTMDDMCKYLLKVINKIEEENDSKMSKV